MEKERKKTRERKKTEIMGSNTELMNTAGKTELMGTGTELMDEAGGRTELMTEVSYGEAAATEESVWRGTIQQDVEEVQEAVLQEPVAESVKFPGISIDKRSDVYSVGATMYTLLTGELRRPKDKKLAISDVSNGLLVVLAKALAYAPDKRYSDAGKMLQAVTSVHKKDKKYRRLLVRQAISFVLVFLLAGVSVLCISEGKQKIAIEKEEHYETLVDKMQEAIVQGVAESVFEEAYEEAVELFPERLDAYYEKANYLYVMKGTETSLVLGGCGISDISALSTLTNLKELYLALNEISDVSELSALTNLERLDLWLNGISDIRGLATLIKLKDLNLDENEISDVSELSALTNLETLYLYENEISDVSELSALTNLERLDLSGNKISDISELSTLTNLKYLYLGDNEISDIRGLFALTNLTELWLGNNEISDISELSALINLTELDLRGNDIDDYSPVAHVANVEK